MSDSPLERRFEVNGYSLAAKEWHVGAPLKVMATHGWLDNAASFDAVAPYLSNCHVIALDLPGHGWSDHKSLQATYNIWDDLLDLLAVIDALGWESCHLLGHSRGAIINMLLAATMPEKIQSAIFLDGITPGTVPLADAANQLRQFLREQQRMVRKKNLFYKTRDDAVRVRAMVSGNRESTARTLLERGLMETTEGFTWTYDQRLRLPSGFKFSPEHMPSLYSAIRVPSLIILAGDGEGDYRQAIVEQVADKAAFHVITMPGSHHFHMEEQAPDVAEAVASFLASHDV